VTYYAPAGDYYYGAAGDPIFGSIGRFLGGVGRTVVSGVRSIAPVVSQGLSLIPHPAAQLAAGGLGLASRLGGGGGPGGALARAPVGGAAQGFAAPRMLGRPAAGAVIPMRGRGGFGYGMTKRGFPRKMRRDGTPYRAPRMNIANPRALRRSLRRVKGFARMARKFIKVERKFKTPRKRAKR
jgi:hypothetical protein